MTGAQYRLKRFIERCGETITVGTETTVGIVTLIHPEAARKHLTDAQVDASNHPLRAIMLLHDNTSIDTSAISVNGENLTVLKVIERRWKGATIYKLALAH